MSALSKVAGHVRGCKCEGCVKALRDYKRAYYESRRPGGTGATPGAVKSDVYFDGKVRLDIPSGCMAGYCWCAAKPVVLSREQVRQGVTVSCGAAECDG